VLNGNKQGNEEGEWTYIGNTGDTVIDYGTVNEEAWERVEEFRIGKRVESDHFPLEISRYRIRTMKKEEREEQRTSRRR
jgi:hypothetical protein